MISCMRQMVFMVVEGATIKLLFEVLTSCPVARSYPKRILISPWREALHPLRKSISSSANIECEIMGQPLLE